MLNLNFVNAPTGFHRSPVNGTNPPSILRAELQQLQRDSTYSHIYDTLGLNLIHARGVVRRHGAAFHTTHNMRTTPRTISEDGVTLSRFRAGPRVALLAVAAGGGVARRRPRAAGSGLREPRPRPVRHGLPPGGGGARRWWRRGLPV